MASDLLGVSISGLRYSQNALRTTGHNIANAGTEGYSRQTVSGVTNPASFHGVGYIGNGVAVDSITRMVDDFVTQQLRTDTSLHQGTDAYHTQMGQLNGLLSDSATGLSSALNTFFSALQNGADDPTSIPARQLVISEAENLSDRFNTLYGRFDAMAKNVDKSLDAGAEQVNTLTQNLAELNVKIGDAIGSGTSPNDLLDRRDETLRKLSELVNIRTLEQSDGQINVMIGNGQSLVVGAQVRKLEVAASLSDPTRQDVFIAGTPRQSITASLDGGQLGGLVRFRDGALEQAFNQLGRIAVVMADTFNQVHQQGISLNNEFGGNFFHDINAPELAAARVWGNSNNAAPDDRELSLNIKDTSQLRASTYQVTLEQGGLYRVVRQSDNQEVSSGLLPGGYPASIEFDGLELMLESGSFQGGDRFTLEPVSYGAKDFATAIDDPLDIAFASPVLTDSAIGNTGTGNISAGELLATTDADGNPLPAFNHPDAPVTPLVVRFTSATTYDVLDNTDPGNPVQLDPPVRNQIFVPGRTNSLFATDPGATRISSDVVPVTFASETITLSGPGISGGAVGVVLDDGMSARQIAAQLSSVSGVSAKAHSYVEFSVAALDIAAPPQITLNGQTLLQHNTGGTALAAAVPAPGTREFDDYMASQINSNNTLSAQGIWADIGPNGVRVYDNNGDDIAIGLQSSAGDTLNLDDGSTSSSLAAGDTTVVRGSLDVDMAEGITLAADPVVSAIFGNTAAAGFAPSSYLGIQASISGKPQAGDSFTIDFNRDGAADSRNALALVNLQSSATISGSYSLSQGYGALVEEVGIQTSSAKISKDAAEEVLTQTTQLRESVSGVNLDEEAANLIRFEQMFSANAQVISVARDLFDRLINSF